MTALPLPLVLATRNVDKTREMVEVKAPVRALNSAASEHKH